MNAAQLPLARPSRYSAIGSSSHLAHSLKRPVSACSVQNSPFKQLLRETLSWSTSLVFFAKSRCAPCRPSQPPRPAPCLQVQVWETPKRTSHLQDLDEAARMQILNSRNENKHALSALLPWACAAQGLGRWIEEDHDLRGQNLSALLCQFRLDWRISGATAVTGISSSDCVELWLCMRTSMYASSLNPPATSSSHMHSLVPNSPHDFWQVPHAHVAARMPS